MTTIQNSLPSIVHKAVYLIDATGWYQKQPQRIPFARLPHKLKVERTQTDSPKQNGAATVIHGEQKKGKFVFYTGLRETKSQNWQYGNDYIFKAGNKIISLVLFNWEPDNSKLEVYYFSGWYNPNRAILENQIEHIINGIVKNETFI